MLKHLLLLGLILTNSAIARRVMITTFDPFGGSPANGSQQAAEALLANHQRENGIEYIVCNLPVVYDDAAARARRCYEEADPKPDMVISTGEGHCQIALETRGLNLDNTGFLADNAGQLRANRPIDVNTTPFEIFTLPIEDMFCVDDNTKIRAAGEVTPSISAGYFVCNNTSYHLNRYFRQREVPYGFIHVPNSRCGTPPAQTADVLHRMIRAGIHRLEAQAGPDGRLPCQIHLQTLQDDLGTPMDIARRLCAQEFRRRIQHVYEVPPDYGR
jgi:pyrrolidone-carboxylate peptidase